MQSDRPVGLTKGQGWEIGVRRTLPLDAVEAWEQIMNLLGLVWDDGVGYERGTAFVTEDDTRAEIISYEQGRLIRLKWQPSGADDTSTLQFRVLPAKTGTTISVHHEQLKSAEQREAMRAHWAGVLASMGASIGP
jgi:uncharacterized protein YndB with AHSA1/START domain